MSYLGKDKRNDCGIHCSPQMRHSRGAEGVLLLTVWLIVCCIASVNKLNKDEFYMKYLIYCEFFFMDYLCSSFPQLKPLLVWQGPFCIAPLQAHCNGCNSAQCRLFGHGLQRHISLNMLEVSPYSVDVGFNSLGRSYSWCNMKTRCRGDVFSCDPAASVRNLKWKMMSETRDVIYQNDQQKVRN